MFVRITFSVNKMEDNLKECLSKINSTKITAKKNGFEELLELLRRNDTVDFINNMSVQNIDSEISWNGLFTTSHNALIDADWNARNKSKISVTSHVRSRTAGSLIFTIVEKASTGPGKALINCDRLLDAIIYVLENEEFRDYGSTYLTVLHQHVLNDRKYWRKIKFEHWRDLFERSQQIYDKPFPNFGIFHVIEIMNLIIEHGCEHSSFVSFIKANKIFCFLQKILKKTAQARNVDLQFNTYSLIVTVCRKLQKECRMAICQFGENIFDIIMNTFEAKFERPSKKTEKMTDLLLIVMEAHHPNGLTRSSGKAYAHDWNCWERIMMQLNYAMLKEITSVHKFGKFRRIPDNLLRLTVEVYNQTFRCSGMSMDVTYGFSINESILEQSSSKKRRIVCGFSDIVQRLNELSNPVDMSPGLRVISSLVSKYPDLVNVEDYVLLLQTISKLLLSSKNPEITDDLFRCCISLINAREKLNFEKSMIPDEKWNLIWDATLRIVGLNQNLEWSHSLLRHMIEHMWSPTMGNAVLRLYFLNVLRFSKHSLLTLHHLRERITFPTSVLDITVHSALLRWLIPINEFSTGTFIFSQLPLVLYARTIFLVCLKNSVKNIFGDSAAPLNRDTEVDVKSCFSVSDIYALNSGDSEILLNSRSLFVESGLKDTDHERCIVNDDSWNYLNILLEESTQSLLERNISLDELTFLQHLCSYVTVLLHIWKFRDLSQINADIDSLKAILEKLVMKLLCEAQKMITTQRDPEKMIKYLTTLSEFFQQIGIIPAEIVESVLEHIIPLLQLIFRLFLEGIRNTGQSDEMEFDEAIEEGCESIFDVRILPVNDRVKVEACKVLVCYSYNYDKINCMQEKILNNVFKSLHFGEEEESQHSEPVFLQMAVYAVGSALKIKQWNAEECFVHLTKVILTLCQVCETQGWTEESAVAILKLIRRFQNCPADTPVAWCNLMALRKWVCSLPKDPGIRPAIEIIHSLELFTKIEIGERCLLYNDNFNPLLIFEDIFGYLQHSSHEVRMNAVSVLVKIFRTVDHLVSNGNNLNVDNIIDKFSTALFKSYETDALTEEEIDEVVNRPLTVLYSLACAISSCQAARRKLIFLFFNMIHEKHVRQDLASKILVTVKNYLKLDSIMDLVNDNFIYIAAQWSKKYGSFQNFPYEVIACSSINEFYKLLLKEVVVVLLFEGKIQELEIVSNSLNRSIHDLCQTCFCEIMAVVLIKFASDHSFVRANEINKLLQKTMGDDVYQKSLLMRLPEIVVCILRHLHDPSFGIPEQCILPSPSIFDVNKNQIEETIFYFKLTAGIEESSLAVYMAQGTPKQIQEILQNLYINVIKAATAEVRLEAWQKYLLFCRFLVPFDKCLTDCKMIAFITRTIVCNLLNFISDDLDSQPLSVSVLNFFEELVSGWVSSSEAHAKSTLVMKEHLNIIVAKLVPFASGHNLLGNASLRCLRCLLIDRYDCLSEAIKNLHQFPDLPEFDDFRSNYLQMQETLSSSDNSTLTSEIEQFLNAVKYSPDFPCTVESLKCLRKQLSTSKDELYSKYKDSISEFRYSENCLDSITHRLVLALLHIINLRDEQVAYEATCCLGEIGLVNLYTLVLQYSHDAYQPNSDPEISIIEYVCRTMKDYVNDKNVQIVRTSSRALHRTLYTTKGRIVASDNLNYTEKLYMLPFIAKSAENIGEGNIWSYFLLEQFKEKVNDELLWLPVVGSHKKWITDLVCAILNSFHEKCFLHIIQPICRSKVSFAENIFKYLVHLLMKCKSSEPRQILSRRINQVLENFFTSDRPEAVPSSSYDSASSPTNNQGEVIFCNKSSIQCLLDVVHFIRLRQLEPHMNDLEINYLFAAKSALYISAYFTSILYCELWINTQIANNGACNDGNIANTLEDIRNLSASNQNELLNTLRESFSKIGDSDALYGCGSSLLVHPETRITHYRQIGNWRRVMESCDAQMNLNPDSCAKINDFSSAIGLAGFSYLQHYYSSSLDQLTDQFYESSWKLGKWDLAEPLECQKTFNFYHYSALKNVQLRHFDDARINIMNARRCLIPSFFGVCSESTKNLYNVLSKLQCLQDIEDILTADPNELIGKWKERDFLNSSLNIGYRTIILNQRIRMADTTSPFGKYFILSVAKKARKAQNFQFAEICLALVKSDGFYDSSLFESKVQLEEARLLWARGEKYIARYLVKEMQKNSHTDEDFNSVLLRTHGMWLSESNLENADTIFNDYFLPAVNLMSKDKFECEKTRKSRAKTLKYVAEFADLQYQQISDYIKSDVFAEQIRVAGESKRQSHVAENRKSKILLVNQSKIEDSQVKEIRNKESRFLLLAMRFYLKVLAESDKADLKIFRIVSLWLHHKTHVDLQREIRENLFKIPSYKFVPVLPQLMAHITRNIAESFGYSLNKLMEKCIEDHPHHTLPLILALANYQHERSLLTQDSTSEERILAARAYIDRYRSHMSFSKVVHQMETLADAYIQLADHKINKCDSGQVFMIPPSLRITKIKNFENIMCPTITVPVSQNGYKDIIGIRRVEPNFTSVGGINAPKKISCLCTDGKIRHQLVKGEDDMRADAVMLQVFTIINKLLYENEHTCKRKLYIRTYKVVPLSQRSGVLEFCVDTISLSQYLTYDVRKGNFGAHHKYRPDDMRTDTARRLLGEAKTDEEKRQRFQKICKKLKPVFRYFFVEKFPSPAIWFERKLAYTHSIAVASMVGYILGIGDRHVANMLIDEITAEVIHIDFGITFDQGLMLNTPEYVPFRFTRDIEDGMGIFSVDGIFRRCCEQTLSVLRENSDIIRTTLEVFIHDPLYQWTLTSEKKASYQNQRAEKLKIGEKDAEVNFTASRALSRIKLKLQGLDEGISTTVEGQVNRVIQQAKDFDNLYRIFAGWQPYL